MYVKYAWENLAMHGRGLWDGARVCYTCEASTQGKGKRSSRWRLFKRREGSFDELVWVAAMVLMHRQCLLIMETCSFLKFEGYGVLW